MADLQGRGHLVHELTPLGCNPQMSKINAYFAKYRTLPRSEPRCHSLNSPDGDWEDPFEDQADCRLREEDWHAPDY